jgi:uncharacterized protein (UPF0548 family)
MKLDDLAGLSLTYPEVGATAGELPAGYHHVCAEARIGSGRDRFKAAADAVLRWDMQRAGGLRLQTTTDRAEPGTDVLGRLGPILVPCRVVCLVDEPDRRGFAYGTLPGHPESGEERFCVRHDPATDAVYAEITAFSRPALWWSRAGRPIMTLAQKLVTRRYLRAV